MRQGQVLFEARRSALPGAGRPAARRARAGRGRRAIAPASEQRRADRLSTENAMSLEERERRAGRRRRSGRAIRRRGRRAPRRGARSRVHQGRLADRRPRQPRAGDARQPRLRRPGRSDAADHGRLGRSDLRVVRRRRADVPALRRARPEAGTRKRAPRGCRFRWRSPTRRRSPHTARCSSSTTSSIRRPARSTAAPSSATPIAASRRACSSASVCRARCPTPACSSKIAPSAPTSIAASCSSSTSDKKIESRPVTLGPIVDGLRVVRNGLTAGELVVVNGLQRVRPGVAGQRGGRADGWCAVKFSSFFITRPIFAIVLSALIVVGGGLALLKLPISEYPGGRAADGRRARGLSRRESEGDRRNGGRRRSSSR